ncbi:MAG: hypothetical protein AB2764_15070 [Candidatus Thiodiazotropha endolucinida]
MNTEAIFANALLSEASYADFEDVNFNSFDEVRDALQRIGTDEDEPDDPDKGFSLTQAREFTRQWEVVHHQPDTNSGFSATLFRNTDGSMDQPYVLAIRGTDGYRDLVITDGSDIVVDGLALDQIVDLWNYWKQLTTPQGETFVGSRLVTLADETTALAAAKLGQIVPGFNMAADAYLEWLYSRDDIIIDNGPLGERVRTIQPVIPAPGDPEFTGVLSNPLTAGELAAVTGHSLGGHLSTALTRLVPGIEALTVNGQVLPRGQSRVLAATRHSISVTCSACWAGPTVLMPLVSSICMATRCRSSSLRTIFLVWCSRVVTNLYLSSRAHGGKMFWATVPVR